MAEPLAVFHIKITVEPPEEGQVGIVQKSKIKGVNDANRAMLCQCLQSLIFLNTR